jgi:LCP family protein required for cell wall assembly
MRHGSARRGGYQQFGRRGGWFARHFPRWHHLGILAKVGYTAATISAAVAVTASVGGYAYYRHLVGNITVVNVGGLTGRTVYGQLNILVLGSQERAGQKGFFGVAPGDSPLTSNSDNLLLVHLNATHTRATILSIPRDTFVYEPACKGRNTFVGSGIHPAIINLIDGALNIGGPTCAVKTTEDLTGIKLDHFVEFDFNSFRTMVDALGGVKVCVPKGGYHDKASGVNLTAGVHTVTYDQALAYVRQRDDLTGPDAGGDLPRIAVQQAFMSSVIQKVNSEGLLSNIPSLLTIADTATKALTVDKSLGSVTSLLHLAKSLVHLHTADVSMITMPTAPDGEHLQTVEPQDDVLFWMILHDMSWHGSLPVQPARKVQVRVYNGTGETGLAARTATSLRKLGFDVVKVGDAPYTSTTTVTYSGVQRSDDAYTLMRALKQFPAGQNLLTEPENQDGFPGPVNLILGANFDGVNPPPVKTATKTTNELSHKKAKKTSKAKTSSTATAAAAYGSQNGPGAVESRNAAENICSGLPLGGG